MAIERALLVSEGRRTASYHAIPSTGEQKADKFTLESRNTVSLRAQDLTMRRSWTFGALALLSLTMLKPTASSAHHNQFQGFDPEREQVVTGAVERFAWQNPHAYIYVSSREGNEARPWRIETLSIAFMRQLGWRPDTIRAGDNVTVTINPSRTEGRATGWLIDIAVEGRDVPSLTDQRRIGAIFSGESTRTDARASSVSGTWISQTGPAAQWTWIDDPSQLELTEAGRRVLESYDPASSKTSCEPRPIPRVMIAADRKSIELAGDVAWIRAEYDATERVAYFDARPPEGRTVHGHSLARWQDGVLIVETSNFTENPHGITDGFPSSTEKHLVERFALNADGQSLVYSFELTDPVYLAEPLTGEMLWLYRPNVDFELVPCDPEATKSFLDN